jgi:DNA uptake protein ComE-like DNA-binding protein
VLHNNELLIFLGEPGLETLRQLFVSGALVALGAVACAGTATAGGPDAAASAPAPAGSAPVATKKSAPPPPVKPIDINSASRAQLKTLPGIGDAEADKIIAGRPYLSKVHIVTESGIPQGVYQSIRHRIVAVQNAQARAKLKALAKEREREQREQKR